MQRPPIACRPHPEPDRALRTGASVAVGLVSCWRAENVRPRAAESTACRPRWRRPHRLTNPKEQPTMQRPSIACRLLLEPDRALRTGASVADELMSCWRAENVRPRAAESTACRPCWRRPHRLTNPKEQPTLQRPSIACRLQPEPDRALRTGANAAVGLVSCRRAENVRPRAAESTACRPRWRRPHRLTNPKEQPTMQRPPIACRLLLEPDRALRTGASAVDRLSTRPLLAASIDPRTEASAASQSFRSPLPELLRTIL